MTMYKFTPLLPSWFIVEHNSALLWGYEHANEGELFQMEIIDLNKGHVWAWTYVSYNEPDCTKCQWMAGAYKHLVSFL